jgi:hypothetical protein
VAIVDVIRPIECLKKRSDVDDFPHLALVDSGLLTKFTICTLDV